MKFYKATDRSGAIHTRSTKDRTYTHAVVHTVYGRSGRYTTWAGRLDLAQTSARQYGGQGEIIDAIEITGPEYRAILKAAKEG